MGKKGYISEFMNGGRIVSHGKIKSLATGFNLPNETPFSVYIRPKFGTSEIDTLLSVKCYQDEAFADAPIAYNDWSPMAIVEIAPDDAILETCDIYWGCGSYVGTV